MKDENTVNSANQTIIYDNDDIKVFEGLKSHAILNNSQLLEILDLNAEQLTYYLEDEILENPFIELEYSIEQQTPAFERFEGSKEIQEMKRNQQSLDTYLFEQIMLYRRTEIRDVMVLLIDYLDERGYLPYKLEELAQNIQADKIVILDAMTLVKQLQPAGIGAYDLRECLMIQAEQDEFAPKAAYQLLEKYFKEVSDQDYVEVQEQSGLSEDEILEAVNYYHTLRANPAALFEHVAKINLIPDITVKESGENLSIRYNRQYYPKVSFNQNYFDEMLAMDDEKLTEYILPHDNHYKTLADNLRKREQLMLEVIAEMVKAQNKFFTKQSKEKSSLSIKQVARAVRLPEPIIYRIVSNKNIEFNSYVYSVMDFINVSDAITRDGLKASFIKDKISEMIDDSSEEIDNTTIMQHLELENILVSEQIIKSYRRSLDK